MSKDVLLSSEQRGADFQIEQLLRELREMLHDRHGWEWEFDQTRVGDDIAIQVVLRPIHWPRITHPAREFQEALSNRQLAALNEAGNIRAKV
jgi:hypothetical protein